MPLPDSSYARAARHAQRALAVAALALLAPLAHAQGAQKPLPPEPPVVPPPIEYSEQARRAYAQGLNDARRMIAERQYEAALRELDALGKDRPREPQARFLRTVVLVDQGRRDDAIVALRDLVADFPELPEPHNNLAVLYAAKGEYELARNELELAIASAPDYAIAYENLGDVHARLAASAYEKAGALDRANRTAPAKLRQVRELFGPLPQATGRGASGTSSSSGSSPASSRGGAPASEAPAATSGPASSPSDKTAPR